MKKAKPSIDLLTGRDLRHLRRAIQEHDTSQRFVAYKVVMAKKLEGPFYGTEAWDGGRDRIGPILKYKPGTTVRLKAKDVDMDRKTACGPGISLLPRDGADYLERVDRKVIRVSFTLKNNLVVIPRSDESFRKFRVRWCRVLKAEVK